MAKSKKQYKEVQKKAGGPYVAAAFFCENIVEDKDGSLSVFRIIDKITLTLGPGTPPGVPSKDKPVPIDVKGLVIFKTGSAPGAHSIRLIANPPVPEGTGKPEQQSAVIMEKEASFSPEPQGGANIRINAGFLVVRGGLFWLDVYLDGKRVTRMPLQIVIQ